MTEKTAVPEYCRGGKKIRGVFNAGICDRLDVDDVSEQTVLPRRVLARLAATLTVAGKHSNR